jgi:hypothetical protein
MLVQFLKMTKPPYLWKAAALGFAGMLFAAIYEVSKHTFVRNIRIWESHILTVLFFGALVFFLSSVFFRREGAKLQESTALSDSSVASLPGAVGIFNAAGNIRRWNENFLGYSAAEMLEKGIMPTIAPESLTCVQETVRGTFEKGSGETEALLIAKSGAKIPLLSYRRAHRIRE